ncbi:MAG TPA: oligosaccharide flippase family protein, partial [Polyangiaceae bacterium]|nr:oligosaccharide flippase family protein [Polyangiaceae bacterium]
MSQSAPDERTSDFGVSRDEPTSTKRALAFVYFGYAFRYLQLLILVPFYGRVLGAAEYGRILAATSLLQMVWLFTEYSLPTVGARGIARARDRREIAALYSSQLLGRLILTPVVLLAGLAAVALSPVLRERPIYGVLATLNGVVMAYNLGWYFQGTLRFRTSVLLEVLGFALSLPLILLFVRGPEDGWLVLVSLLASGVVSVLTAHVLALRTLERSALRWSGGLQLLRDSALLFAHKGLNVMMTSSSTYLISLFATATQVGWYGAADRIVNAAMGL